MRIGHLQPSRPEWFDRTPATVALDGSTSVNGTQAETTISQYTIPTGKKAYLDMAQISSFRLSAGTPDAIFAHTLYYNNGGSDVTIFQVRSSVSTFGAVGDQWVGQCGVMMPGDLIKWTAQSTFTNGLVTSRATAKVTTFDA